MADVIWTYTAWHSPPFQQTLFFTDRALYRPGQTIQYKGSLTIEAFGAALPELAAATKIWRRMFEDEEQLAKDGLAFMKLQWETP